MAMEGTRRANVKPGISVMVELTVDKRTGRLTGGKVKEVLTSSPTHPHGIKVMLENGEVGRIKTDNLTTSYSTINQFFI